MLDVVSIVIRESEKLLQLFYRGWLWPHTYSLNLVWVGAQTTCLNYMPQVRHQCFTKEILSVLNKQLITMQFFKHSTQVQQVLFNGWTKYQYIIKVDSHTVH